MIIISKLDTNKLYATPKQNYSSIYKANNKLGYLYIHISRDIRYRNKICSQFIFDELLFPVFHYNLSFISEKKFNYCGTNIYYWSYYSSTELKNFMNF